MRSGSVVDLDWLREIALAGPFSGKWWPLLLLRLPAAALTKVTRAKLVRGDRDRLVQMLWCLRETDLGAAGTQIRSTLLHHADPAVRHHAHRAWPHAAA